MSESKFINVVEFLEDFKGEDQYGAVAQVFEIMPTNSIIVSSEGSDLEFQIATTLSDLFVAENSYEVQTDIGTFL